LKCKTLALLSFKDSSTQKEDKYEKKKKTCSKKGSHKAYMALEVRLASHLGFLSFLSSSLWLALL